MTIDASTALSYNPQLDLIKESTLRRIAIFSVKMSVDSVGRYRHHWVNSCHQSASDGSSWQLDPPIATECLTVLNPQASEGNRAG